ncbi:MAG: adenylosuccinate lyase [Spirochaetes bacterium]|nr:adenylosuccinate lyase [Spirochaetota bacterium]MBU1080280.1 adenylosuccinate lyase [Spirochaetota bacterium]
MIDHTVYQSPFSWRYGSAAMREAWSDVSKRRLWRSIWVSLARVQSEFGLVSSAQVDELAARASEIDIERALEIEAEIRHDLMAEVKAFAELCPTAGGVIHLGATSMDVEDNADALRLRRALDLVIASLDGLLSALADKIDAYANLPVMAFTHVQPAEPTTLGYRLAMWAQDLLEDRERLVRERDAVRGKGFKGAVGTAASYAELVGEGNVERFEARLSSELGIAFYPIATQTYTRKQDYSVVSTLAGLGASLHKFALDMRILQSPPIGELSEPFGAKQVGSSAMPFKRNPINAEKIDSLARSLSVMPQVAWQNAAQSILERTLDDSANRRSMLPEAFLICDEILATASKIVSGLVVNEQAIARTMAAYGPFANTERVLMAMGKAGADRQETHERLREHALAAWAELRSAGAGAANTLAGRIASDPFFTGTLGREALDGLMTGADYSGTAPKRAREMAATIRHAIGG